MKVKNLFIASLLLPLISLTWSCSIIADAEEAVADIEQGQVKTKAYPLTQNEASDIIATAFNEEWPDKEIVPYETLPQSLSIQLRFALDKERIIVQPVGADNDISFVIINRGTAPAVGVPARKKLLSLIEKLASEKVSGKQR